MQEFQPAYFFDLTSYRHQKLFVDEEPVWNALNKIKAYLEKQTLGYIEAIDISSQAYLIDTHLISIGKNTVIEPGAYIKGPCIIGENCTIRHGAYIRGNVIVGNGCVIGHDTEIKHSILLDNAHAAHFAYLGDSILGNRVNLGAGTKCANLRLDDEPVAILYEKERINTGLRKLGAIIGDDCSIGCNAVTNPGTLLGPHIFCSPLVNIGGFVSSHSIISLSHKPMIRKKA